MAFMIEKIMKLETSLTWDDFHGDSATIEVVNEGGVDSIASWEHPSVTQPSDSAINAITDATILGEHDMKMLRMERNAKLAETDWTQSRDVTLSNDSAWSTYRQALRDITDSATSLDDVTWHKKPE